MHRPDEEIAGLVELQQVSPPSNTLALPDITKISLLLSSADKNSLSPLNPSSSLTAGILKRDRLHKHRTRVPAVVVALFISDHVSGDPKQWLQLCSDLENLKAVLRPKNIKLVVVVVHSSSDDISEDRIIALRKRAELESKYLVVFNPADSSQLEQSLNKLGNTFAELANTYYRDEGRRSSVSLENGDAVFALWNQKKTISHKYKNLCAGFRFLFSMLDQVPPEPSAGPSYFVLNQETHAVALDQETQEEEPLIQVAECRICQEEDSVNNLEIPCACTGSLKDMETRSKMIHSNFSPALGTSERSLTEWKFQPAYYYQLGGASYLDRQGYKPIKEKLKPNKQAVRLKHSPNKARQESKKLSLTSQKSSGQQSEEGKIPNS
uniref:RING-CH-type domain-containing protein n=1 Tax=Manihot esculenta TaxID=3983 RepID=A0A2C9V1F8_MANES